MKRLSMLFLTSIMLLGILAGCSSKSSSDSKTLTIGVDDSFAPMGFRDKDNNLVGFDIDYAKAAAKKMGYKVDIQPIEWKAKESELNSGRIDLIWNGYTITDERKKKVDFSKPYLKNAQVVATLAKTDLSSLKDLKGKIVGLQAQSSAADALDVSPIKATLKSTSEYANNVMALNDLKSGRTDAVIIDEVVIDYYMAKDPGTFKVLDESLSPEEYGVGVKKGNEKLLNKLQKALDSMNEDGTAKKISNKWFGEDKVLK